MFEHRAALRAGENAGGKRQSLRVAGDRYARRGDDIEVDIARYLPPGAADIEIPLPQRKILRFGRIRDQRQGRLKQTLQPPVQRCEALFR
jgi:hypothetical protein